MILTQDHAHKSINAMHGTLAHTKWVVRMDGPAVAAPLRVSAGVCSQCTFLFFFLQTGKTASASRAYRYPLQEAFRGAIVHVPHHVGWSEMREYESRLVLSRAEIAGACPELEVESLEVGENPMV